MKRLSFLLFALCVSPAVAQEAGAVSRTEDVVVRFADGTSQSSSFSLALAGVAARPQAPCTTGGTVLCLNGGRFKVTVTWRAVNQGTSGAGNAVAVTSDTGYFWFFSAANIELVIKVLDGRAFNNFFWVFFGALSDVEYTITITDLVTGATKTYTNQQGTLASVADTSAFPSNANCGYSLSSTATSVGPAGGSISVGVTAPAGCTWIATSNDGFLTITSGSSGSSLSWVYSSAMPTAVAARFARALASRTVVSPKRWGVR